MAAEALPVTPTFTVEGADMRVDISPKTPTPVDVTKDVGDTKRWLIGDQAQLDETITLFEV